MTTFFLIVELAVVTLIQAQGGLVEKWLGKTADMLLDGTYKVLPFRHADLSLRPFLTFVRPNAKTIAHGVQQLGKAKVETASVGQAYREGQYNDFAANPSSRSGSWDRPPAEQLDGKPPPAIAPPDPLNIDIAYLGNQNLGKLYSAVDDFVLPQPAQETDPEKALAASRTADIFFEMTRQGAKPRDILRKYNARVDKDLLDLIDRRRVLAEHVGDTNGAIFLAKLKVELEDMDTNTDSTSLKLLSKCVQLLEKYEVDKPSEGKKLVASRLLRLFTSGAAVPAPLTLRRFSRDIIWFYEEMYALRTWEHAYQRQKEEFMKRRIRNFPMGEGRKELIKHFRRQAKAMDNQLKMLARVAKVLEIVNSLGTETN